MHSWHCVSALTPLDDIKKSHLASFNKKYKLVYRVLSSHEFARIFFLCELTQWIPWGILLIECAGFVLVQSSFASLRQLAGVTWEHGTLYSRGILRAVQVLGPDHRPSGNVLNTMNRIAPNHSIPTESHVLCFTFDSCVPEAGEGEGDFLLTSPCFCCYRYHGAWGRGPKPLPISRAGPVWLWQPAGHRPVATSRSDCC